MQTTAITRTTRNPGSRILVDSSGGGELVEGDAMSVRLDLGLDDDLASVPEVEADLELVALRKGPGEAHDHQVMASWLEGHRCPRRDLEAGDGMHAGHAGAVGGRFV